jgi:hypothetical protein
VVRGCGVCWVNMGDVQGSSILLRAEDSHIAVHCKIVRKSIRPVASACISTADKSGHRDVDTGKLYASKHALRYLDDLVTNDLKLLSTMPPNRALLDDIIPEFLDLAGSSDIFLHLEGESYLRF